MLTIILKVRADTEIMWAVAFAKHLSKCFDIIIQNLGTHFLKMFLFCEEPFV
jgi:hypothetical protein